MSWHPGRAVRSRSSGPSTLANRSSNAIQEPFDLATFERLLGRGPQAAREDGHRTAHYMFNPGLKTIAEYVALLRANEAYEDSR